jgi:hypothetical protein
VIGETRPHQRREHIIAQDKVLGISPVIGNIGLVKLCEAIIAVEADQITLTITPQQVKAIHLSVVIGHPGSLRRVIDIWNLIGFVLQRHNVAC